MIRVPLQLRQTRLAYWRKKRGLTQQEVAEWIGVCPATVRNWEASITIPTKDRAEDLAHLLRVGLRELFPFHIF